MRILAVRGRNLASLAGDFEVDFEAEPLGSAGIFAITGPTGAGKSTLLDAMCLALFNTLPRLGAAANARIGGEEGQAIGARDTRGILRHGAGEGYAEVDFTGRGRRRCRARWSVRRARDKAEGALQNIRMAFADLDSGEQLGGTNSQTLEEIQRSVGLTAEQFTRAVMLAQGEFDAFVRANPDDRAILLERLTGTPVYARLGAAAFEKARSLEAELKEMQTRIGAQSGLGDEERAAAEAELAAARAAHEAAAAGLASVSAVSAWGAEAASLQDRVSRCAAALEVAAAEQERAEPRRLALQQARAAFAFVPEWTALRDARARASQCTAAVTELERKLTEERSAEQQARVAEEKAGEEAASAWSEAERLAPDLEEARRLDRAIAEAALKLVKSAELLGERRSNASNKAAEHERARDACRDTTQERDSLASWLSENASRADLAMREPELTEDLYKLAKADGWRKDAERALEEAALALAGARNTAQDREAAQADAQQKLDKACAALRDAQAAVPSADILARFQDDRDTLTALPPLASMVEASEARLADGIALVATRSQEREELTWEVEKMKDRRREIEGRHPALLATRGEAARTQALSEAAAELAAAKMRDMLVEGEPCPVCGATEHAIEAVDALLRDRLDADRKRLDELDRELASLGKEDAALDARIAGDSRRRGVLDADITDAAARVENERKTLAGARQTLADAVQGAKLPLDFGRLDVFRTDAANRLATVDAERRRLAELQTRLDVTRQLEAACRREADTSREACLLATGEATNASEHHATLRASLREATTERDRLDRDIDARLSSYFYWRGADNAADLLSAMAAEWRDRRARHEHAVRSHEDLTKAVHQAALAAQAAADALMVIDNDVAQQQKLLGQHRDARALLLGGEATDLVEERLRAAAQSTRTTLERARVTREQRGLAAASAETSLANVRESLRVENEDVERRAGAFARSLSAVSIDEPAVAAAAAAGRETLEREENELARLAQAVRDSQVALDTRRTDLAAHLASERPVFDGGDVAEALVAATRLEAEARAIQEEASFTIRRDDEARERSAALRAKLDLAREKADVWLRLNALIGSRNGDVFRRFAQGLTLDRLIGYSNARLTELKPRYALERGRGGDMLIQVVDHDMGGEVRGLHNLSGGERFLVSLALALGLSEMSSGRGLVIESLFIDEGFGALDGESLGAAIAVLEQLHATGRRVGVISHIEELKERIPVKIEVMPVSRGRSELSVVAH